jgi:hypothetical protein
MLSSACSRSLPILRRQAEELDRAFAAVCAVPAIRRYVDANWMVMVFAFTTPYWAAFEIIRDLGHAFVIDLCDIYVRWDEYYRRVNFANIMFETMRRGNLLPGWFYAPLPDPPYNWGHQPSRPAGSGPEAPNAGAQVHPGALAVMQRPDHDQEVSPNFRYTGHPNTTGQMQGQAPP